MPTRERVCKKKKTTGKEKEGKKTESLYLAAEWKEKKNCKPMGESQKTHSKKNEEKIAYLATEWSECMCACVVDVLKVDRCAS